MLPAESSALRGNPQERSSLQDRLDELRALIPELPAGSEKTTIEEFSRDLLDLLERKQRHLIQGNIRLAALRDLTETLLRDPEEERVLRTLSLYLRQAHGLAEVLVLSRTEEGGLRGYRARNCSASFCEAIRWSAATIHGTAWARALSGESVRANAPSEHPPGTPPPLPVILPLRRVTDEQGIRDEQVADAPCMGLLAIRPDDATGAGNDPLAVEQLAYQVSALLESVRQQQRTIQDRRFRECLLEAMDDGLIAVSGAGKITAANRAALALLGVPEESIVGRPLEDLKGTSPRIVAACRECAEKNRPLRHQEAWIEQAGGRTPVNLSVVPLADAPEEVGGIVATFSDLRPLRAMEEELRRLDRLAALGRFAAAVAHEIRNPLAAIGAGVDFLSNSLGQECQSDLKLLRTEIARLDRIVVDLLEPMRTQPLHLEETPVATLVQRACQTVEPLARERGVHLLLDCRSEESCEGMSLMVDGDRFLQVLVNLVRNAVEASPAGGEVEVGWESGDGEPAVRRVWVRDQGAGIAPEHLEHLFEPFYSTKSGGTGLGLYVSHSVIEQHGGKLQVESEPDCGTTVTICLPAPLRQGEEVCRHRS